MTYAVMAGSRDWGDTYILDVIIGGMVDSNKGFPKEPVVVVSNHHQEPGLGSRARIVADARHRVETVHVEELWDRVDCIFVFDDNIITGGEQWLEALNIAQQLNIPMYHIRHINAGYIEKLKRAVARRKRNRG